MVRPTGNPDAGKNGHFKRSLHVPVIKIPFYPRKKKRKDDLAKKQKRKDDLTKKKKRKDDLTK
jgi:hypothetical protein